MKKEFTPLLSLSLLLLGIQSMNAQQNQVFPSKENICGSAKAMNELYQSIPETKKEHDACEAFTTEYVKTFSSTANSKAPAVAKYRIPVVCHVYGNSFWGKALTDLQITNALAEVTTDFQGLNADYATVNNNFASLKSNISVSFELAKIDPSGKVTTGIDRKTTTGAGYGNGTPPAQLALDAWDNKKYMNIYIVADLYNDGVNNNSGVCWYPDVSMTNAKTARLVFNGQYIGTNSTNAEFRGVLTHECGHFLNLAHTFDTGCTGNGDGVADTPVHSSTSLGCPTSQTSSTPISDCGNWVINSENYMDYNGAFCGYKNYTKGQVARMDAALNKNDVTRFPLWQTPNLIATGLLPATAINETIAISNISMYPNPTNGVFQLDLNVSNLDTYTLEVTNVVGQIVYSKNLGNITGNYHTQIDIANEAKGIYLLFVKGADAKKVVKLIKQ